MRDCFKTQYIYKQEFGRQDNMVKIACKHAHARVLGSDQLIQKFKYLPCFLFEIKV